MPHGVHDIYTQTYKVYSINKGEVTPITLTKRTRDMLAILDSKKEMYEGIVLRLIDFTKMLTTRGD